MTLLRAAWDHATTSTSGGLEMAGCAVLVEKDAYRTHRL
jgi:hypothetical protein